MNRAPLHQAFRTLRTLQLARTTSFQARGALSLNHITHSACSPSSSGRLATFPTIAKVRTQPDLTLRGSIASQLSGTDAYGRVSGNGSGALACIACVSQSSARLLTMQEGLSKSRRLLSWVVYIDLPPRYPSILTKARFPDPSLLFRDPSLGSLLLVVEVTVRHLVLSLIIGCCGYLSLRPACIPSLIHHCPS